MREHFRCGGRPLVFFPMKEYMATLEVRVLPEWVVFGWEGEGKKHAKAVGYDYDLNSASTLFLTCSFR